MALMIFALAWAVQVSVAPTPLAPQKPRLVCRKSEQETGSHIHATRRCKTEDEWARDDAERTRLSPSARITEGQGDALTRSPPH
jgi:hypothetical protein